MQTLRSAAETHKAAITPTFDEHKQNKRLFIISVWQTTNEVLTLLADNRK